MAQGAAGKKGRRLGISTLADGLTRGAERISGTVTGAFFEPVIRIGVTGLARAGKTVFITSLVANLLERGRMPGLVAAHEGRIAAAFLQPQPDDTVPRFDFESHLAALTAPTPHWPDSTRAISELRLSLRVRPAGLLAGLTGPRTVHIDIVDYPGESDRGLFPVADNVPIEGWPVIYQRGNTTSKLPMLAQVQSRPDQYEGDRHAIIVDPVNRKLYEFFTFGKVQNSWAAGQASVFDLSSNELRPEGWTSADAAGLPIFPAVVRYDELQRGVVEHAMRVTVRRSRRAYVHPATHYASRLDDENLPRMGERLRLRADFDTSEFSAPVKAILEGLKKYGMLVADNGIEWAISVTPDPRIPVLHEELRKIRGADFEVVVAPE
jgi:GTPase SAR1 family protein